jgi:hypothetical protein
MGTTERAVTLAKIPTNLTPYLHKLSKTSNLDPMICRSFYKFKTLLKADLAVSTPEISELYWCLLQLFTKNDPKKMEKPLITIMQPKLPTMYPWACWYMP